MRSESPTKAGVGWFLPTHCASLEFRQTRATQGEEPGRCLRYLAPQ